MRLQAETHAHTRADLIRRQYNSAAPEEQALQLLALSRYRRGSRTLSETGHERAAEQIRESIRRDLDVTFTLCFLPAKIRHPLKTFARDGTEVDLGEAGALLRLHEVATALSLLLHRTVRATISSDGMRYAHCMGVKSETVRGYQRNIRLLISALGLCQTVSIVDEATLLPLHWGDDVEREITNIRDQIKKSDEQTIAEIRALQPAVALCTDIDPSLPLSDLLLAHACDLTSEERRIRSSSAADLREQLEKTSLEATIGYIAANRVMTHLQLFRQCWPLTVKGTVHPKVGEIGLKPVNEATDNVFPYHGQGHFTFNGNERQKIDDIRISFVVDLLRRKDADQLRAVVLSPETYPFSNGKHPFLIERVP